MLILLNIDYAMIPAKSWKRPEILPDGFHITRTDKVMNRLEKHRKVLTEDFKTEND